MITDDALQVHAPKSKGSRAERMKPPNSKYVLRRLLNFANFLAQNLENLRNIATPLYKLSGSKYDFVREKQPQEAFDAIKELLVSSALLEVPV